MKALILAVGQRLPTWAEAACEDYLKRFPADCKLEVRALKTEPRTLGKTVEALKSAEYNRFKNALPKGACVIALDEKGKTCTTRQLAEKLTHWQGEGRDLVFLIGGPDGLHDDLKKSADDALRLSDLTLPHAMARVVLIEALYRAWSVNAGHPYHRE
jgi:23S rRNA (pseudouridine1915-N3)-methyltransferase